MVLYIWVWQNTHDFHGKWFPVQRIIIYPDYINAVKTVAQGRRIPKELGVQQLSDMAKR